MILPGGFSEKNLLKIKNTNQIIIRTDASKSIGIGHLKRCLALAQILRKHNFNCYFICRDYENSPIFDEIRKEKFEIKKLPFCKVLEATPKKKLSVLPYKRFSKINWQWDAKETIKALDGNRPEWLIVDHYELDFRWERALQKHVKKILVIDDLANRKHSADLLVDQNLIEGLELRYVGLLPAKCEHLLGTSYAILRPEFGELHLSTPPRCGPIRRILVFFSGADRQGLTKLAIQAFMALNRKDIFLDVVVGPFQSDSEDLRKLIHGKDNINFHETIPCLASLMMKADLAIGAGGTTSWERCCLGLPALIVTMSKNQYPIAASLHKNGFVRWLGNFNTINKRILMKALQKLLNEDRLFSWSQHCATLVDGKGGERIAEIMMIDGTTPIKARLAKNKDEKLLLELPIDISSVEPFSTKTKREQVNYREWLNLCLRYREDNRVYILETNKKIAFGYAFLKNSNCGWNILIKGSKIFWGQKVLQKIRREVLWQLRIEEKGSLKINSIKTDKQKQKKNNNLSFIRRKKKIGSFSVALCSDSDSWINIFIPDLIQELVHGGIQCSWTHRVEDVAPCDLCFYMSYSKIVSSEARSKFKNNLVIHESDLPRGRGWSPLSWQVLQGKKTIVVTLFEASEVVDSGSIYLQKTIRFHGDELVDELRQQQAKVTFDLCLKFISRYPNVLRRARKQTGRPSYFPRRTAKDSRLSLNLPLRKQLNLLRISDNTRYPAWFEHAERRFALRISRLV